MSRYSSNPQRIKFFEKISQITISSDDIHERCRFNFSYFDGTQEAGLDFSNMSAEDLAVFLEKLKNYTRSSLNYWRNERCGGKRGLRILADYDDGFPENSDFTHPKKVPTDARWGRFRMENMLRLIGFTIPASAVDKHGKKLPALDLNTFYVVFIDPDHRFYKTEEK